MAPKSPKYAFKLNCDRMATRHSAHLVSAGQVGPGPAAEERDQEGEGRAVPEAMGQADELEEIQDEQCDPEADCGLHELDAAFLRPPSSPRPLPLEYRNFEAGAAVDNQPEEAMGQAN